MRTSKLSSRAEAHPFIHGRRLRREQGNVLAQRRHSFDVLADDLGQREIRIIERVARIDDALLRGVKEGLRLFHVAARPDTGLLAGLGLIQQRIEGLTLGDVGRQLIRRGQDPEIRLRHSKQQTLLGALVAGFRRRDLKIGFLQLAERLKTPQGLRHVESQ